MKRLWWNYGLYNDLKQIFAKKERRGRLPGQGTFLPHIAGREAQQRTSVSSLRRLSNE
jgi:hypothetical protein